MMKTLVCLTLAVSALASPALSFAQLAPSPVTRAQVRAGLVRLEQAGYTPGADNASYPVDIQAAEANIAAQDSQQLASGSVGGTAQGGSTQAGASVHAAPVRFVYAGR
ncbi:DUF4148 domain-containing protein [Paraburkholderia sp. FT54]|uniref:DUF4148 domain-containing protein n=1 Tax=Paraburkholderia sp. FT54 TaxID=3074437 RepID=UPI00287815CB|nr:DUF4148 domain-containing protein [Paraburkholderia sp. FT54]WNC91744.1 DUF4148 domain-containing protein [Paraburkholderia sp. FT54]